MQSSDSDYSPIKKKGRPKPAVLESSSYSSEDDSDIPVRKRRSRPRVSSSSSEDSMVISRAHKKPRVLSDEESSDSGSSDSEVEGVFRRWGQDKKNKLPLLTDSESSDDNAKAEDPGKSESGSQTSDEESEKCIICFKAFRGAVAHPSGCKHNFHTECLLTWSKTSNTCPIDRVKYTQVIVSAPDGRVVSRHDVKTPPPQDHNDIEPDDPTFCEVCHQHDREHEMLLCDRCEAGYHLTCLDPPLIEVPVGDWFCPRCERHARDDSIDADEINDLLREGVMLEERLRGRQRPEQAQRRVGPRTRAAQRVIAAIRHMAEQAEMLQPSTSSSRRRTASSSGSRRGRRGGGGGRKKASRSTSGGGRTRSCRYQVELVTVEDGSTIQVKVAVNTTAKSRRKKRSVTKRRASKKRSEKRRSGGSGRGENYRSLDSVPGLHSLDIMGSRPTLDYFSGCEAEDEFEPDGGGGVGGLRAAARSSVTSARGMASRKELAVRLLRREGGGSVAAAAPSRRVVQPRIAVSSAPPDLLSSILDQQTRWHSPNAVIQSNREGDVKVVLPEKGERSGVRSAAGGGSSSGGGGGGSGSTGGGGGAGGGGSRVSSGGSSSSSSGSTPLVGPTIPPLEPPPQPPLFSRVYDDDDFDLYGDIEPPKLAPPPEPPALLLAMETEEGASSPEDTQLVIDDRQTYDPDLPTSPPPSPPEPPLPEKLASEAQGALDLSSIRLPSPEPEIDDCPNRVIYSATSLNIAKDKEDSDEEALELPKPPDFAMKRPPEPPALQQKPNGHHDSSLIKDTSTIKKDSKVVVQEPQDEKPVNDSDKYDPDELSDDDEEEEEDVKEDVKDDSQVSVIKENRTSVVKEDSEELKPKIEADKIESGNDDSAGEKVKLENDDVEIKEDINSPKEADEKDEVKEEDSAKKEEVKEEDSAKKEEIRVEASEKEEETISEIKKNEQVVDEEEEEEEGELKEKDDENPDEITSGEEVLKVKEQIGKDGSRSPSPSSKPSSPGKVADGELRDKDSDEEDGEMKPGGSPKTRSRTSKDKSRDSSRGSTPRPPKEGEGEDVLELREDERDGLVDITDEEISTYEKSWELEENQVTKEKSEGLEGLETEAISEGEDTMAEEGQVRTPAANGPKEDGEIVTAEKRAPVAWKKVTKAKERSYREKDSSIKDKNKKNKEKKPKEKRKELERYDVRKVISEKPRRKVDEFGRDISGSRSGSLSESRSKSPPSRSPSRSVVSMRRRSRTPRSRERSRGRRPRSREQRSRERRNSRPRSRGKSSRERPRSRVRSRERNKRGPLVGRSKSRSRSRERRKSRSPRKKERRSRPKSREKKKRRRESSMSCSSCSCSSCERERRKGKKLTVIVPNDPPKKDRKKKKDPRRRRVDSPVPSKEVFTSGDNILVSVNFSKSSKSGDAGRKEKKKKDEESKKKKDKSSKENQPLRSIVSKSGSNQQSKRNRVNTKNLKPVAIIDLAQSPYREQVLSPKEVIVLTDSDSEDKRKPEESSMAPCQITGPKTPPEPHIKFNIVSSKPQMLRSLANPLLGEGDQMEADGEEEEEVEEIPYKGPNTPPEPPVPYDPFEPTKSRSPTPLEDREEGGRPAPTPPGGDKTLPQEPQQRPVSPPKPLAEPPKTPSPLHSPPPKPPDDSLPVHISPSNNCDDDYDMDVGGGDSPYSPGSSDGDEIFEPPPSQITVPLPLPKLKARPVQKLFPPKLTPSPLKRKPGTKLTPLKKDKKNSMPMNEDQLKILDDLPNSAVEMQVKDKFLKKLNRQERVVEEVKLVLKPHYVKKHITKEEYKEIMRKCVPKICHSRSGEINPLKIQRLIDAYIKKYRHLRKKRKGGGNDFAPTIPLLKPKPTKATMWS